MSTKIDDCPKCGRPEKVDVNARLKLCAQCFMLEADEYAANEMRKAQHIDWQKTLAAIRKVTRWTQATLAHWLRIPETTLSDIKHYRRAMPGETFHRLQERFSKEIVYTENQPLSGKSSQGAIYPSKPDFCELSA